ncbi:MAG: DUF3592 domain-containing protein [Clostridia bacterium]|nr:DUF3592 domain-containing protein [Clostridia bacterium]
MSKSYSSVLNEQRRPAIVFLSIAFALFLAFIGFFAWNTVSMRNYELNNVKIMGKVVDVETHHSTAGTNHGSRTYYYLVITYEYGGQEYTFTDRVGHQYIERGTVGSSTQIYVNPQNPAQAEKVTSSGFVSIICACFFAFFFVTYSVGMNILLSIGRNTFKKRLFFVWGVVILLGILFLLLFWLGLPNSGFGEVFARIEGAIGLTVISALALLVVFLDGIITLKLNSKMR